MCHANLFQTTNINVNIKLLVEKLYVIKHVKNKNVSLNEIKVIEQIKHIRILQPSKKRRHLMLMTISFEVMLQSHKKYFAKYIPFYIE